MSSEYACAFFKFNKKFVLHGKVDTKTWLIPNLIKNIGIDYLQRRPLTKNRITRRFIFKNNTLFTKNNISSSIFRLKKCVYSILKFVIFNIILQDKNYKMV